MAGHVYLVTNNLNGKQYVGQTIVATNKVGHGKLMTKAYEKHGKDNFTYDMICGGLSNKAILNFAERFWIKVMDSRLPNGYNIEHGGSDKDKVSAETREKQRQNNLGKKHSEITKAKMSASRTNPSAETRAKLSAVHTGRACSAETRAKIGNAQKGRVMPKETKAKIRAARKLQVFSAETKQKLSDAAKKQWARQKGVV